MSTQPLYSALQGGDYHVYPDGSILMSGAHSLYDTARGFAGIYNLIWFTNTGHLDTTKTHRYCNGVIYEIEQQPDGKFLCSGTCSTYEGQPVRRVFRVHADGALDTSFDPQVVWGRVSEFLVLEDTRIVVVGRFGLDELPGDTIRMARLLSNGELDPSFDPNIVFGLGTIPNYLDLGVIPNSVDHWPGGRYLVTGTFQQVNGEPRFGLCVVDSSGALMPEFSGAGVGTYVYQGQVLGGVSGVHFTPDNMLYLYGTFHGYTDGTTNDPDQRFITRLYGPDLSTGNPSSTATPMPGLHVFPNPNDGRFTVVLPAGCGQAQARLLDASGRVVLEYSLTGGAEQQQLSAAAEPGAYVLLVEGVDGQRWQARVVVE